MTQASLASAVDARQARSEAIREPLRPKVDEGARQRVERAVAVPEAVEFGAIDFAFRDAGQKLATAIRQAAVRSRKKRGT